MTTENKVATFAPNTSEIEQVSIGWVGGADETYRSGGKTDVSLQASNFRTAFHPSLAWMMIFCFAYIMPGLIGHDPWKQDEAYIFSGIHHMVQTHDWVVPYVAGEPFMEKPPLFHIVGATLATLASPLLPLHDGARLASGFFITFVLLSLAWSARCSWGDGYGRHAALLLMSSVGLIIHAHMMLTDLALMTGFSVAIAGFVACAYRYRWGGMLLGLGAGIGFMGKGLIAPGVIGLTAAALPIIFKEWRRRAYYWQLAVAVANRMADGSFSALAGTFQNLVLGKQYWPLRRFFSADSGG